MGKLFIISGDDDFTVKAKARTAAAELCRGEPDGSDMEIIDADAESIKFPELTARLLETLRTPPMFALLGVRLLAPRCCCFRRNLHPLPE